MYSVARILIVEDFFAPSIECLFLMAKDLLRDFHCLVLFEFDARTNTYFMALSSVQAKVDFIRIKLVIL